MSASNPAGTVPDNKFPNLVEVKKILNVKKMNGSPKTSSKQISIILPPLLPI